MTTELEQLFDAAGRQAPSSDGWNADDLITRGGRRRNTRRALTAAGAFVTAVALVIGATTFIPKGNVDVAPVDGERTNTSHDVLDGLDITTTGPAVLHLRDKYIVTMVVKNTTSTEWRGGLGAGIWRSGYKGNILQFGDTKIDGHALPNPDGLTEGGAPGGERETFLTWGPGSSSDTAPLTTIAAGQTITVTSTVSRTLLSQPFENAFGWIPAVTHPDQPLAYADMKRHSAVTGDPVTGDPSCTSIEMTSTKILSSRWRLADAALKTDNSLWRYVVGDGSTGFGQGLVMGDHSYLVDQQLVRLGLQSAGIALTAMDNWPSPTAELSAKYVALGHSLVAYNGAKFVEIEYVGKCVPTGKPVTGIYLGGGDTEVGVVNCDIVPSSGTSLEINAALWCPTGTVARKYGKPDGFMPGAIQQTVDATPPPAIP